MARFKPQKKRTPQVRGQQSKRNAAVPSEPVTVVIDSLNHDGQGVSRSRDKVLFVEGALPSETVEVQITQAQRSFDVGQIKQVITPSAERVEPPCEHYQRCGGCQLQHLDSSFQLGHKQANLDQNLKRHLKLDQLPWQAPIESSPFGYRRRARLGVRYRNEQDQIIVGFREQANKHLSDLARCPVLLPELSALMSPLKALIQGLQQKSRITQVELLKANCGPVVVLRHLKTLPEEDLSELKQWAQQADIALWLQPDQPEGLHCLWPQPAPELNYEVDGLMLRFEVKDFIQGNEAVNAHMVAQAMAWLNPQGHETVLDLYAGMGNFSLALAKRCKSVLAVEGDGAMVARLQENAAANGLSNIQGMALNLSDPELFGRLTKTDIILLDPPRAGAAELIPWLSRQKARILYVACEPSALVRDAKGLLEAGYGITKIGVMDMFPQTRHVETMALFERKK